MKVKLNQSACTSENQEDSSKLKSFIIKVWRSNTGAIRVKVNENIVLCSLKYLWN